MSSATSTPAVTPTLLCSVCTGIFTGDWMLQLNGWKRKPGDEFDPLNREPAFGTAYEHGMLPYVNKYAAPPTLSYPHHTVANLRISSSSCPLCRIVLLILDAPEKVVGGIMDYMAGRKPVGRDRWSAEEIENANGYVFIYTEKGQNSKLVFRYHVNKFWEATRNVKMDRKMGEREGNLKDVMLELFDLADKKNNDFLGWMDQGSSVERVEKWLKEDNEKYTRYLPSHFARELPTRLLRLTLGSPHPIIELIDDCNSILDNSVLYVALSHSWGNCMPIQLTQDLLETFTTNGILFNDLPKTFQDAVSLSLQLEISYLWIDSLCIIQDSPSDWLHEAQRMATVYTFSHLTIAASASLNPTTGLSPISPHPHPVIVRPTWIFLTKGWNLHPNQLLRVDGSRYKIFNHAITTAPLNQRGWTYQEYILSPRVLHCAEGEWWWRTISSQGIFRESSSKPMSFFTGEISLTWPDSHRFYARGMKGYDKRNLDIIVWNCLVSQYNQRILTKRKDKVVAFGAVAQIFGRLNRLPVEKPGEFLAGCWKSHLPFGLLWLVGEKGERYYSKPGDVDDQKYSIPSWSWASVDGMVRFSDGKAIDWKPSKRTSGMAKVIDVAVTTEGGSFGPVLNGYIVLHSPLLRIRAERNINEGNNQTAWFRDFCVLRVDDSETCKLGGLTFSLDTWSGRVDKWEQEKEMYCAVIDEDIGSLVCGFALLLERVDGREDGVYRRIGATQIILWDGSKKLLEKVRGDGRQALKDGEYIVMDNETGHCTYKII